MFNTVSRIALWFEKRRAERRERRCQEGYDFARDAYFKRKLSGAELRQHVQESKDFDTYNDFDRGVERFLIEHKTISYMLGAQEVNDE